MFKHGYLLSKLPNASFFMLYISDLYGGTGMRQCYTTFKFSPPDYFSKGGSILNIRGFI